MQGRPSEALALYLELLEASPDREEILLNALQAAVEASDWQQVRRLALRAATVSPGSLPAKEALAQADFAEERFEEALAAFRELNAVAPAFLEPWYYIGACLFRLGRYTEAAEALQGALRIDSRHLESRLALAEALRLDGRLEEARAALESVADSPQATAEAWLRLGLLRAETGQLEEALLAAEQARQLGAPEDHPDLVQLHAAVAALLQDRGGYARAADLYRLALSVRQDDAILLFNYGSTLASLGRLEEAQAAWKQALERDPSLAPALIEALEPQPVRNHHNGAA